MLEQELENLAEYHEGLLAEYDARFDFMPLDKQLAELKKENKKLREEFKKLSGLITQFVASKKAEAQKKTPATLPVPSPVTVESLKKVLNSVEIEHQQLVNRINQVSDPEYETELKEKLIVLEQRIKKTDKSRKNLEIDQMHRSKALNRVADAGECEMFAEINNVKKDLTIVDKKMAEVGEEIEKNAGTLQEKHAKMLEAKTTYKRLIGEANGLGIVDNDTNVQGDSKKIEEIYKKLSERKWTLKKNVNALKAKENVDLHDYAKKVDTLETQLTKLAVKLQTKNEELIGKREELDKLVNVEPHTRGTSTANVKQVSKKEGACIIMPLSRENLAKFNAKEMPSLLPDQEIKEAATENEEYQLAVNAAKVRENLCAKRIQKFWKKYHSNK